MNEGRRHWKLAAAFVQHANTGRRRAYAVIGTIAAECKNDSARGKRRLLIGRTFSETRVKRVKDKLAVHEFSKHCRMSGNCSVRTKRGMEEEACQEQTRTESVQWELVDTLAKIQSPWMTIVLERLRDNKSNLLDYWRIERADSVIVLVVYRGQLVFPKMQFRPGIGRATLDFPGGRVDAGSNLLDAAFGVLERELGLTRNDVDRLELMNGTVSSESASAHASGWIINSSLSNQCLYGCVAYVREDAYIQTHMMHARTYHLDEQTDVRNLLGKDLTCLQCRAVLMEWLLTRAS